VVYLPALAGGACLEDQAGLARYTSTFAMLRATALTAQDSTRLLREAAARRPPWD
jgi:hypothetical protein